MTSVPLLRKSVAEREAADHPHAAAVDLGLDAGVEPAIEVELGSRVGQGRVRALPGGTLTADVLEGEQVAARIEAEQPDWPRQAGQRIAPQRLILGDEVKRMRLGHPRSPPGQLEPPPRERDGFRDHVSLAVDQDQVAVDPPDDRDHVVQQGVAEPVLHQHQHDREGRSRDGAEEPPPGLREVPPGQRNDSARQLRPSPLAALGAN